MLLARPDVRRQQSVFSATSTDAMGLPCTSACLDVSCRIRRLTTRPVEATIFWTMDLRRRIRRNPTLESIGPLGGPARAMRCLLEVGNPSRCTYSTTCVGIVKLDEPLGSSSLVPSGRAGCVLRQSQATRRVDRTLEAMPAGRDPVQDSRWRLQRLGPRRRDRRPCDPP